MCPQHNFWDVAGNANFESLVLEDVRPCRWAKDGRCERYFPDNGALDLEQRIVGAHAQTRESHLPLHGLLPSATVKMLKMLKMLMMRYGMS